MAIGKTKFDEMLNRSRQLVSAIAWYDYFTTEKRLFIIDMIRQNQLKEKGIDKTGDVIGFYSAATEWISQGKKQEGDPYTLEDTGEFYNSIFITVYKDLMEIDAGAGAQKDDGHLFDKYGTGIVGLTEENTNKFIADLRTHYIDYARKILLGTK